MIKTLRSALLALPLALTAGHVSAGASVQDISDWFNGWSTLRSPFTQVNGDGSVDTGTLYMARPGKLRIEYDNQDTKLIVGSGSVAIFDGKGGAERPDVYPLKRTPLWQILRPDVDLTSSNSVRSVKRSRNGKVIVRVYDPKNPEAGEVDLYFADREESAHLTGWTSYPGSGAPVTVQLTSMVIGEKMSLSLFSRHAASASD